MAVVESTIAVPAEDAAVQLAFEQLDARLNAWVAAMQQLGTVLRRGEAQDRCPSESPPAASAAQVVRPDPSPVAEIPTPAADATPNALADAACDPVAEAPLALAPAEVPAESTDLSAEAPAETAAVDEDEALMATLDPETAKAIRVRRRLTVGRKSVRELLAEYSAEQGRPIVGESGKKSWWRLGK